MFISCHLNHLFFKETGGIVEKEKIKGTHIFLFKNLYKADYYYYYYYYYVHKFISTLTVFILHISFVWWVLSRIFINTL